MKYLYYQPSLCSRSSFLARSMTESLSALAPFFSGDTNTDDFCANMGFPVYRSLLIID